MLARALLVRLFGTKRLAVESTLWLAGILLLLGTLPSILLLALEGLALYVVLLYSLTCMGLILYILPGVLVLVIGSSLGWGVIILFLRGYLNLTIRCLNWLRLKYYLAQDDLYLEALFAESPA